MSLAGRRHLPDVKRRAIVSLLLLAASLAARRAVATGLDFFSNPQQTESIPNDAYKLQMLHEQHDSGPETIEIIRARGFTTELYTILSRDRQPISMHHVINPLADPLRLNKYPVLVWHGISGDSSQMISHSELARPRRPEPGRLTVDPSDTALAFMLANNNFDVWLADARGTSLNNHQVSADLNFLEGNKYWNFSLDEQIHYDVPAVLDFVLEQTHEDKLHYVGFSQSTTFIFAFLTKFPHYQAKMVSLVALAPVAFTAGLNGSALSLFGAAALVPDSINGNYIPQFVTDTVGVSLHKLCQLELAAQTVCQFAGRTVSGLGDNEVSHGFFATTLRSTSIKAIKHFLQLYLQRRFGMYDYGRAGNLRQYGQPTPPDYDLALITLPTLIIFRGTNDFLSDPIDQHLLLSKLGTRPYLDFNIPNFNHLDFVLSRDIVRLVNAPALRAMFHLLHVSAENEASPTGIFRDPRKLQLPRMKPNAIFLPNFNRRLELRSNLVNNLINGLSEITAGKILPNDGGKITESPLTPTHFKGPDSLYKNQAVSLNGLDSRLTGALLPELVFG